MKKSKLNLEELYKDVDRVWDCSTCGTPLAVTTVAPFCPKCGEMQKRLLSIEEAGKILKMDLKSESFPTRVRLDEKGKICEEFVDAMDLVRMWRAIERLKLGD